MVPVKPPPTIKTCALIFPRPVPVLVVPNAVTRPLPGSRDAVSQMSKAGREHLAEVGMDYRAHRRRAWRIGTRLSVAGAACLIHSLLPGMFRDKASRTIEDLNEELKAAAPPQAEPVLLEFEI